MSTEKHKAVLAGERVPASLRGERVPASLREKRGLAEESVIV